jgi:hypothetical protein
MRGLGFMHLFMHLALERRVPPLQIWHTNSNLMKVMSVILALNDSTFRVIPRASRNSKAAQNW